jgi:fructokinase
MILCCGEALIDMVPATSAEGEACFIPKAGGAVFNTAIALGRLGSDTSLYTGVSGDLFGTLLKGTLTASNVRTAYLRTMDADSTLAFVELTDGNASYTFYARNTADTMLTPADLPDVADAKALFFGGISLCTDPTASTLQAFMRQQSGTRLTMIDPNIRAAFIKDEASYRARLHDMIAHADILKISDEDLNWLVPDSTDIATQLATLTDGAGKLAFVTRGSKGALAFHGTREIAQASATTVTVADTIGAGDTFNAGILHVLQTAGALDKSFVQNPDIAIIDQALALATRAAGITVSRTGANPPWAREL